MTCVECVVVVVSFISVVASLSAHWRILGLKDELICAVAKIMSDIEVLHSKHDFGEDAIRSDIRKLRDRIEALDGERP